MNLDYTNAKAEMSIRSERNKKWKDNCRVVITKDCNRSCEFCCMKDPEITDTFRRVTGNYVAKARYSVVNITGGEPTLNMHNLITLVCLVKYYKPDAIVYVYTNGDLLTREEADMMKVAGVDGINWSPHGGIDNYQRNHWAFIHSCVIPVRMRIQDTMIHDDLIQWCDNNGIEVCEWSIGDCYDMPDEDRYEISWRD